MSNALLNLAWKVDGLTHAQKLVLVRLADYANDTRKAWPNRETLCEQCGVSERHLQTVIHALTEMKHITPQRISGRTRSGESRFEYVIHPQPTQEVASGVTQEVASVDTGSGFRRHRKPLPPTQEVASVPYIEPHRTPRNHQGNQPPDYASLEPWQLDREERSASDNLKAYKDAQQPDQTLISYEAARLKAIRQEKRRRAPPTNSRPPAMKMVALASELKPLAETFTAQGHEEFEKLKALKHEL